MVDGGSFTAIVEQALPRIRALLFAGDPEQAPAIFDEYFLIQEAANTVSFSWSCDPLLAIFQKHFLVRHCLYRINHELVEEGRFALDITALGVTLLPLAAPLHCQLSEQSGKLASFYLNERHFFETNAEEVGELIASFWRQYSASDDESESLEVLGLSSRASWNEIKARYREQVMLLHPDRGGNNHAFTRVQAAYSDLKRLRGK